MTHNYCHEFMKAIFSTSSLNCCGVPGKFPDRANLFSISEIVNEICGMDYDFPVL